MNSSDVVISVAIIALLIGFCVRSNRIKTLADPKFKCYHQYGPQAVLWTTTISITHRLICQKCGFVRDTETYHCDQVRLR